MEFNSPFLIVYIGTSLFSVFLPLRMGYEKLWGGLLCCDDDDNGGKVVIIPWRRYSPLRHHEPIIVADDSLEEEDGIITSNLYSDVIHPEDCSFDPSNAIDMQNSSRFHNEMSAPTPLQQSASDHDDDAVPTTFNSNHLYSHQDHISMAMKVAPLWFTSNYFYAISLEWTTIASSTVLASMGSLFAFFFATCSKYGDETITKTKLLGVFLCFMGGVATTYTDVRDDNESTPNYSWRGLVTETDASLIPLRLLNAIDNNSNDTLSLWGDMAGLLSAIGYGAYTVLLRHLCPKDESRMSMQLFFGYVGVLNMTILLPIAIWIITTSQGSNEDDDDLNNDPVDETSSITTHHSTISWSIFLFLVLKGLLDNVLSDYLWARAVILTSATVASVSVGLTIPMAFVADFVMGNHDAHGTGQILGAVFVLLGFVFVNINGGEEEKTRDDEVVGNVEGGEIEFENT
eukprot:scaffold82729_cov40-Cyclotella_meneghiniana.AAC.3